VSGGDWHGANQRHLTTALARVAAALDRHGRSEDSEAVQTAEAELARTAAELPGPSALDTLCAAFTLSPFERDVVLLCAGVELDSGFADRCAAAHGDPRRGYATFSLALAALPDAHWSALAPAAPLRGWRLVDVLPGDALTTSPLRIDERVLHYLTGVDYLDERLRGLVEPLPEPPPLLPSLQALAERAATLLRLAQPAPLLQLVGPEPTAARAVAGAAAAAAGLRLATLRAADVPVTPVEREALARLCERESILAGCALLLELADDEPPETVRAAAAFARHVHAPLALAARDPVPVPYRAVARLEVTRPTREEQLSLWRRRVGDAGSELEDGLDALVAQFDLGLDALDGAQAQLPAAGASAAELWDACRAQARVRLDDLAQRIEPRAGWEDLVLPPLEREILREIAAQVRHRTTVYERWGFAAKSARGLGISALFAGPSGTGKTMAAEVLAGELRLDLYRIDLSQVVSKYIGETEKNLRRVFDAAEAGGAILLFDEADALFGKRSEVKDSHDRYANIEVSYLLQRMESYRGLAILTSNRKEALDDAFLRRIRFVVQFPFPEVAQRTEIWQRIFPAATPTSELDPDVLARLSVTGGNIRNIALHASFLAADEGAPVRMDHLLRAARREYAKLERPLTTAETGGWQ
jgi:ATPase family associated with various cellular activities (AAA)/Winged helix domain, variant